MDLIALSRDRHPSTWRIEYLDPEVEFDAPEFYEKGIVASVEHSGNVVLIEREGDAMLEYGLAVFTEPDEFRRSFPDGALPSSGAEFLWVNNAWFDLYAEIDGEIEHLDSVHMSLDAAVADAVGRLSL